MDTGIKKLSTYKQNFYKKSIHTKFEIGSSYVKTEDCLLFYINKIAIDIAILQFFDKNVINEEIKQLKAEIKHVNNFSSQTI